MNQKNEEPGYSLRQLIQYALKLGSLGFAGAILAAFATFLPCYLFTVIPAPYFQKR